MANMRLLQVWRDFHSGEIRGVLCVKLGDRAGCFDKFGPFAELFSQKHHLSAPVTSLIQAAADTWSWRNILSQNKRQAGPAAYMEWKILSSILIESFYVWKHLGWHEVNLLFTWNQCYSPVHGGRRAASSTYFQYWFICFFAKIHSYKKRSQPYSCQVVIWHSNNNSDVEKNEIFSLTHRSPCCPQQTRILFLFFDNAESRKLASCASKSWRLPKKKCVENVWIKGGLSADFVKCNFLTVTLTFYWSELNNRNPTTFCRIRLCTLCLNTFWVCVNSF